MSAFTLEPVDAITLTVLMDNVTDMLLPDDGVVHRAGIASGPPPTRQSIVVEGGESPDMLIAEHGLSVLVTMEKDSRTRHILYDTGVSPDGLAENMRRLDISPKDVDTIVMSHGHFDHTGGFDGLIRALGGTANLPVTLHPEFWSRRRIAIPGRDPFELPTTSKSALLGAGFDITEERQPSFLLDRSLLITGEVDRTTEFEKGFPIHQKLHDGEWVPDPLILDDQALIAHVRGKGLVVLSGCGHAGIVNIVRYAQKLTGVDEIYAIVGGFHLSGAVFEPIIGDTVAALTAIQPKLIMPGHCTGWRAQHALAMTLPDAWVQAAVGTRLELTSSD
jgi:7,8-dihydropterin-6-yl-methyl-4-(beta-D-ribofuranosyl)aminobenzene 5'-phosphate synthase